VYRTAARSNSVPTMMGKFFGVNTVNIDAIATAEASPANAMTCVKPFTIPDRWMEGGTRLSEPDDTYEYGQDTYIPADQEGYTGYNAERDKGMEMMIRAGTGNNIQPSFYFSYAIGDVSGGDEYRDNIANCNSTIMGWGDPLMAEPGDMVGPTNQGIDDLIAKDPDAYWDEDLNKPVSTVNPSPRVVIIPLYDPEYYDTGKRNGRNADLKVANYLGFFIERRQGNNVYGRITPVAGLMKGNGGPAPAGAFPKAIRLVE
jgi:hypothetical protein